jgi:hypothetical protein
MRAKKTSRGLVSLFCLCGRPARRADGSPLVKWGVPCCPRCDEIERRQARKSRPFVGVASRRGDA